MSLALLAAVIALVMFVALRSPLKDDIAWLLYVARRWLAGKELYVDVIEVNPPLIIWISAIPAKLGKWLEIDARFLAMPFFAGLALAIAWAAACVLRPRGGLFADRVAVFAILGSVLLLIPAGDLGQREHLLVAAFLPYLALFARTLDGERPPVLLSALTGILAGLGAALKPQYGLAFAALEAMALCRGVRPWRVAPVAAGTTMVAYVGLVALICPDYLRNAVPMALALYGATDVSFLRLLADSAPLLTAEALAVCLVWIDRDKIAPERTLAIAGLVFAAAANVVCFVDGKDWFYHRLPAAVVTVLVLALWTASAIRNRPVSKSAAAPAARGRLAVAFLSLLLFGLSAVQRLEPELRDAVEPRASTVARLETLLRLHHARSYVALSEWIALGFPVVNNTGVMWASRFDSMWALEGEVWRASQDPNAAREWPVAYWVARDFVAGCPDIVVVDTRGKMNYINVLSAASNGFRKVWPRYKQIVAFDGLTVWKRTTAGCVKPWLSAAGADARTATPDGSAAPIATIR